MSAEKYPLTHAAGLRVISEYDSTKKAYAHVVDADVIEAWLAGAPVVEGWQHKAGYVCPGQKVDEDTHWRGRVVCREPIVRDSAESLLREEVERMNKRISEGWEYVSQKDNYWLERARKYLGEK